MIEEEHNDDEHDFLQELCVSAVCVDRKVIFAGIVDSSGKLLVGECRENRKKKKDNSTYYYIEPTFFYSYVLASGMEKWKTELQTTNDDIRSSSDVDCGSNDLYFNVLELNCLKLAITPLTKRGEVYLCVCMESSASCQQIISKICKSI